MAKGDSSDLAAKLQALVPGGWFGSTAPVRDVVIGGLADSLSFVYGLFAAVRAQTRINTASGYFLDLIGWDFLGSRVMRGSHENDATWRSRIIREIFRPRLTRPALTQAITDLVGTPPQIYEPWNTGDCGAYDVGTLAYAGALAAPTLGGYDTPLGGYDVGYLAYAAPAANSVYGFSSGAGCYGSYELPNQIFLKIKRPPSPALATLEAGGYGYYDRSLALGGGVPGIPNYPGMDSPIAGLDVGPMFYSFPLGQVGEFQGAGSYAPTDLASVEVGISDNEIYAVVAATKAAGVTAWVGLNVS